ncbi:Uma2 family endonuclease [Leptolyngbya sp. DQ-M1]|uniref:Uma2 family endonuclease n=1 Tax=Leptolyngbya sp. DQ-M1 TaxID=2933920 RepID=UPI003296A96D
MTIAAKQELSFDQFLEQYPEDGRYELVDGEIVRILATRQHEDIADFIADAMKDEVKLRQLNYKVSDRIVLATQTQAGKEHGRNPDVSVVDLALWRSNRLAYAALQEPIQLALEVVSTNWEDDYIDKLDEYQRMGISEYWIVDYLAIGSRTYLGNPKTPTVFVYLLDESGVYQSTAFKEDDRILSRTFPELTLTLNQILNA